MEKTSGFREHRACEKNRPGAYHSTSRPIFYLSHSLTPPHTHTSCSIIISWPSALGPWPFSLINPTTYSRLLLHHYILALGPLFSLTPPHTLPRSIFPSDVSTKKSLSRPPYPNRSRSPSKSPSLLWHSPPDGSSPSILSYSTYSCSSLNLSSIRSGVHPWPLALIHGPWPSTLILGPWPLALIHGPWPSSLASLHKCIRPLFPNG